MILILKTEVQIFNTLLRQNRKLMLLADLGIENWVGRQRVCLYVIDAEEVRLRMIIMEVSKLFGIPGI